MADEPNLTPETPLAEALGNQTEARNPDGSLKDQQTPPTPEVEPKPDAEKKPEDEAEKKPAEAAKGPPEKYEFKAPEGYEIDPKFAEEASAVFKELGLTQDAAQKLVDMYSAKVTAAIETPFKAYEDLRADWRKEVVADKDIGNGKDDLKPEVKAAIGHAIDSLPNAKEFREAMVLTGAGDNPAIVRAFASFASRLAEGKGVNGSGPSPLGQTSKATLPSAAQALFPNLPSSAS
jgi:hypothetical protein